MSVLGFDIGNLNCYISVARQGGIEVITNDYSLHATPACVAFTSKDRSMGDAARQAVNTNFKNTIIYFKQLLGRKYSDPVTQKFIPFIPCEVVALPNDDIGLKVSYLENTEVFSPEQVFSALLTKLRKIVEAQLPDVKKVSDCVVAVPSYFTDVQRRAVQASIQFANLNALRIINETTAVALTYGIYKQDLPEENAKAKHVVFLDIGHSSTQASLVAFNKGKLTMLRTAHTMDAGGLWFDNMIREHFRLEFRNKYGIDAKSSPRAWLRLLDESEKVKKQMSANQTPIPLNIECFMDDKDVSAKMQRAEFEDIATPLFAVIRRVLEELFIEGPIKPEEVDEVEIVGGSSRIPMIRKIIHDLFAKEAKTTMNQDEAVARGAAMQCAILSPTYRVREFSIKDSQPFRIGITWNGGAAEGGESVAFTESDEFPFSKMVTLFRSDAFQIDARYISPNTVPHTQSHLGTWHVSGVKPTAEGEARKVKVKVRVNPNGVFSVCSATMYETQVVPEEPMEVDAAAPPAAEGAEPAADPAAEPAKPKTKTISIDLPIREVVPVNYDVQKYAGIELQMQQVDEKQKRKADARNSVEAYVYEMRDKISDQFADFVSPQAAEEFRQELTVTEDWLYDEGEDVEQQVYEKRLEALKRHGDPIVERYREAQHRQPAFDDFDQVIARGRKAYEDYVAGGELYAHLDSKDMEKVINAIEDKKKWLDDARHRQERLAKTEAPVIFVEEINQQRSAFENIINPILNKKKPAPPKQEAPKKEAPQQQQQAGDASQSEMDVD
ncbi:unnamed protein product [Caenorhabditis auriculariae]|uniref:Uncharacterized protein n=1 Tax=Caenorhabditis auriculariae TaxID=2777116 RepID=A0A8S1H3S5_9PELO|nr:unnamed protein product [Caenorhabditis auriculariae]